MKNILVTQEHDSVVLAVFALFKLPTPPGDKEEAAGGASSENSSFFGLLKRPHFALGVLAEFIFIGLQVAGMAVFSAYALKHWGAGVTAGTAAMMLSALATREYSCSSSTFEPSIVPTATTSGRP